MANNTILAMNALQSNIIREITPLSDKDCFYIAERYKTEFTYPIHNHAEFELNFTEKAAGVRRIVGDSAEVISDYDLVLITGKDLEHVWEQHDCHSKEIREITIQFSSDLFFKSFINKNQFDSIRDIVNSTLAVSNIRNRTYTNCEVYLIDYGYGNFKEKIHFME